LPGEEDAKQAEEEIRSGAGFDNVMKRMVTEGKAEGREEGVYMKGKDLLPEIAVRSRSFRKAGSARR